MLGTSAPVVVLQCTVSLLQCCSALCHCCGAAVHCGIAILLHCTVTAAVHCVIVAVHCFTAAVRFWHCTALQSVLYFHRIEVITDTALHCLVNNILPAVTHNVINSCFTPDLDKELQRTSSSYPQVA